MNDIALYNASLRRLLQVEVIERLALAYLPDELALLLFSSKVDHLVYEIYASQLFKADLASLKIAAQKLTLSISHHGKESFPTESVLCVLR